MNLRLTRPPVAAIPTAHDAKLQIISLRRDAMSKDYTLVFHLAGKKALEATMGKTTTQAALGEIETNVNTLLPTLLPGVAASCQACDANGVWCIPFVATPQDRVLSDNETEYEETIRSAAAHAIGEISRDIFGLATYRLANLRTALFEGHLDPHDALARLAALPEPPHAETEAQLRQILENDGLRTLLQPLVRFPGGELIGYEALSRGPVGSPLERADNLFAAGAVCGLSHELEAACARKALRFLPKLPPGLWMAINLSSASFADNRLLDEISRPGVIFEITEHLPLGRIETLRPMMQKVRSGGARISLDDTGCGYADMDSAEAIRPDSIKLCITIIRSVSRHSELMLNELGERIARLQSLGIRVLAEGVESETERDILARFPIDYAQGWLYGKPRPAEEICGKLD
jgi:EAL domain-containing protein (putative c-di-GMP-specific phosphodiesterase class I)